MAAKKPLVLDLTTGNLQQIQTGDFIDIPQGGTGATTAAGALAALGAYPASNPNGYITSAGAPVQSVAGRAGAVVLTQADIGGLTTASSPTFAGVTATTFTGALSGNATSATNLAAGAAGSLPYQTGAGATSFLNLGSAGQILVVSGSAPAWANVSSLTLISTQVTNALGYSPVNPNTLGVANGVATLDTTGKLTTSQIPAALVGALQYQGVWNASTNSPALTSSTGTKGQYYKVGTAGATALDGISQWNVGDMVVFDGTVWDKIDGLSSEVTSVAGRVGAVVLSQSDISGLTTGSSPTFAAVTAATFTGALAGNASTATSIAGGAAGGLPYQTGAGATAFLAAGTAGYVLTSNGAGAPTWSNLAAIAPVQSVAGRTGAVVLTQADIGGLTTGSSPTFAGVTAATFTGALAGNAATATADVSSLTNDNGSALVICNVVYNDTSTSGGFQAAKADAAGTSMPIGLLSAGIANGAAGNVVTGGELSATAAQWQAVGAGASGLTPGAQYFLSNTTAGQITTTVPTTGFVVKIGTALTPTRMLINIGQRIQL